MKSLKFLLAVLEFWAILLMGFGVVQMVGFLGIEYHLGNFLAFGALGSFILRIMFPLTLVLTLV